MPFYGTRPIQAEVLSREELLQVFRNHDKNGDGRLDVYELKVAFEKLGAGLPGWRAWRGLRFADANGDGSLTDDELKSLAEYAYKYGYTVKESTKSTY